MAKRTINVARPFTLALGGGRSVNLKAGIQLVDQEVADHKYTQQFLAPTGVGTDQHLATMKLSVVASWAKAEAAWEDYEALAREYAAVCEDAGKDPGEPPHAVFFRGKAEAEQPEGEPADDDSPDKMTAAAAEEPETAGAVEQAEEAPETETAAETEADVEGEGDAEAQAGNPLDLDGDGNAGGSVHETSDKPFDEMTDDELRAFIEKRDGKAPHPNATRANLLRKARKETADAGE